MYQLAHMAVKGGTLGHATGSTTFGLFTNPSLCVLPPYHLYSNNTIMQANK